MPRRWLESIAHCVSMEVAYDVAREDVFGGTTPILGIIVIIVWKLAGDFPESGVGYLSGRRGLARHNL